MAEVMTPEQGAVDQGQETDESQEGAGIADPSTAEQPETEETNPSQETAIETEALTREQQEKMERIKKVKPLDAAIRKTAELARNGKLERQNKYRKESTKEATVKMLKRFSTKALIGTGLGAVIAGPIGALTGVSSAAGSELGRGLAKLVRMGAHKIQEMKMGGETEEDRLRNELEEFYAERYANLGELALATVQSFGLEDGEKVDFEDGQYTADEMRLKFLEFVSKISNPKSEENVEIKKKEADYNKLVRGWRALEGVSSFIGGLIGGGIATEMMKGLLTNQIAHAGVTLKGEGLGRLTDYGSDSLRQMQEMGHNVHLQGNSDALVFDYHQGELGEIAKALNDVNTPQWLNHSFNSDLIQHGMHEAGNMSAQFNAAVNEMVTTQVTELMVAAGLTALVGDMIGDPGRILDKKVNYRGINKDNKNLTKALNQRIESANSGGGSSSVEPEAVEVIRANIGQAYIFNSSSGNALSFGINPEEPIGIDGQPIDGPYVNTLQPGNRVILKSVDESTGLVEVELDYDGVTTPVPKMKMDVFLKNFQEENPRPQASASEVVEDQDVDVQLGEDLSNVDVELGPQGPDMSDLEKRAEAIKELQKHVGEYKVIDCGSINNSDTYNKPVSIDFPGLGNIAFNVDRSEANTLWMPTEYLIQSIQDSGTEIPEIKLVPKKLDDRQYELKGNFNIGAESNVAVEAFVVEADKLREKGKKVVVRGCNGEIREYLGSEKQEGNERTFHFAGENNDLNSNHTFSIYSADWYVEKQGDAAVVMDDGEEEKALGQDESSAESLSEDKGEFGGISLGETETIEQPEAGVRAPEQTENRTEKEKEINEIIDRIGEFTYFRENNGEAFMGNYENVNDQDRIRDEFDKIEEIAGKKVSLIDAPIPLWVDAKVRLKPYSESNDSPDDQDLFLAVEILDFPPVERLDDWERHLPTAEEYKKMAEMSAAPFSSEIIIRDVDGRLYEVDYVDMDGDLLNSVIARPVDSGTLDYVGEPMQVSYNVLSDWYNKTPETDQQERKKTAETIQNILDEAGPFEIKPSLFGQKINDPKIAKIKRDIYDQTGLKAEINDYSIPEGVTAKVRFAPTTGHTHGDHLPLYLEILDFPPVKNMIGWERHLPSPGSKEQLIERWNSDPSPVIYARIYDNSICLVDDVDLMPGTSGFIYGTRVNKKTLKPNGDDSIRIEGKLCDWYVKKEGAKIRDDEVDEEPGADSAETLDEVEELVNAEIEKIGEFEIEKDQFGRIMLPSDVESKISDMKLNTGQEIRIDESYVPVGVKAIVYFNSYKKEPWHDENVISLRLHVVNFPPLEQLRSLTRHLSGYESKEDFAKFMATENHPDVIFRTTENKVYLAHDVESGSLGRIENIKALPFDPETMQPLSDQEETVEGFEFSEWYEGSSSVEDGPVAPEKEGTDSRSFDLQDKDGKEVSFIISKGDRIRLGEQRIVVKGWDENGDHLALNYTEGSESKTTDLSKREWKTTLQTLYNNNKLIKS